MATLMMLFALVTVRVEASSSGRYLYNLDPYDIDPKSWAEWRKGLGKQDWEEWCNDLNLQRWKWWRESLGPKNWAHWKETMGPDDKALWTESSKLLPGIMAREEQEEGAVHFKKKIMQLKVRANVVPKQPSSSQTDNDSRANSPAQPSNSKVQPTK